MVLLWVRNQSNRRKPTSSTWRKQIIPRINDGNCARAAMVREARVLASERAGQLTLYRLVSLLRATVYVFPVKL